MGKWTKYGVVEIYQGNDGLVVGRGHKWSVFGDEVKVKKDVSKIEARLGII